MNLLLSHEDWQRAGQKRYGPNTMAWRFACPACGHVATPADWQAVGAPEGAVAFSCVGRWTSAKREAFTKAHEALPDPCNYAGGGLFGLNPISVMDPDEGMHRVHKIFDFADEPLGSTYSLAERERA